MGKSPIAKRKTKPISQKPLWRGVVAPLEVVDPGVLVFRERRSDAEGAYIMPKSQGPIGTSTRSLDAHGRVEHPEPPLAPGKTLFIVTVHKDQTECTVHAACSQPCLPSPAKPLSAADLQSSSRHGKSRQQAPAPDTARDPHRARAPTSQRRNPTDRILRPTA